MYNLKEYFIQNITFYHFNISIHVGLKCLLLGFANIRTFEGKFKILYTSLESRKTVFNKSRAIRRYINKLNFL